MPDPTKTQDLADLLRAAAHGDGSRPVFVLLGTETYLVKEVLHGHSAVYLRAELERQTMVPSAPVRTK